MLWSRQILPFISQKTLFVANQLPLERAEHRKCQCWPALTSQTEGQATASNVFFKARWTRGNVKDSVSKLTDNKTVGLCIWVTSVYLYVTYCCWTRRVCESSTPLLSLRTFSTSLSSSSLCFFFKASITETQTHERSHNFNTISH